MANPDAEAVSYTEVKNTLAEAYKSKIAALPTSSGFSGATRKLSAETAARLSSWPKDAPSFSLAEANLAKDGT